MSTREAVQKESAIAPMKTAADRREILPLHVNHRQRSWSEQIRPPPAQIFHDKSRHNRLAYSHYQVQEGDLQDDTNTHCRKGASLYSRKHYDHDRKAFPTSDPQNAATAPRVNSSEGRSHNRRGNSAHDFADIHKGVCPISPPRRGRWLR